MSLARVLRVSVALFACSVGSTQAIGTVTTLAGGLGGTTAGSADGTGTAATFNLPPYVTADATGTVAFVADYGNYLIRTVVISSRLVSTLAGAAGLSGTADGIGTSALFNRPVGVALDAAGTFVLVVRFDRSGLRCLPRDARQTPLCRPTGLTTFSGASRSCLTR